MNSMMQVEFHHTAKNKVVVKKVVWVDSSWNLKKGHVVKFVQDIREWQVITIYKARLPVECIDLKWGLNLPKSQRTER